MTGSSSPSASPTELSQIDALCNAFEAELRSERPTRIEVWLEKTPSVDRGVLFRYLLEVEVDVRRERGENVVLEDYEFRFADLRDVIVDVVSADPVESETIIAVEPTGTFSNDDKRSSDTTATIGTRKQLGNYEIIDKIGGGGMGVVYKAHQAGLNRFVALKTIKSGLLAGDEEIARFRNEAEAAGRLNHPNIVPVYEFDECDGQQFFAMEFVEGEDLDAALANGPMSPLEAAMLMRTIAEAVQFAHGKGVVHRDLKPSNILLDAADGRPRITDFGLARRIDRDDNLTRDGQIMGTPSYMPPEQTTGESQATGPHSDVYSLGAMLYRLLTGRPPFQSKDQFELFRMIREKEPIPLRKAASGIPRDLETICAKCLQKNPADRYESAGDFAEDLRRYLNREPILAQPEQRVRRLWKWCRRNPVKSTACVVFALLMAGFGTYRMSRPAWVRIHVTPADARVELDGREIELVEGEYAATLPPGSRRLRIKATGYHSYDEQIVLSRGRDNETVLNIQLRSARGRLQLKTEPPGAIARLFDAGGKRIGEWTTPFENVDLPAGDYRLEILKDLYQSKSLDVRIPDGGRVASTDMVVLKPQNDMPGYLRLKGIVTVLDEKISNVPHVKGRTLTAVLAEFGQRHNVKFELNSKNNTPIAGELRQQSGEPLTLGDALEQLLSGRNLVVIPVGVRGHRRFSVVDTASAESTETSIAFPVHDLADGSDARLSRIMDGLIQATRGPWVLQQGSGATVSRRPGGAAIVVTGSWKTQIETFRFLNELRRARIQGDRPKRIVRSHKHHKLNRSFQLDLDASPPGYLLYVGPVVAAVRPGTRSMRGVPFAGIGKGDLIAGTQTSGPEFREFVLSPTDMRMIKRPDRCRSLYAFAINGRGTVVGTCRLGGSNYSRAFRWDGKKSTVLDPLPGDTLNEARDINDQGVAVGWSGRVRKMPGWRRRAVVFRDGKCNPIPTGTPNGDSVANAINNRNQIVGYAEFRVRGKSVRNAFYFDGMKSHRLGTLRGATMSTATDINDDGVAVGWSTQRAGSRRAFRYSHPGKLQELPPLRGDSANAAVAINNSGAIVGWSAPFQGSVIAQRKPGLSTNRSRAFVYRDQKMTDVHPLRWTSSEGVDVSDDGWILGRGNDPRGQFRGFVLLPINSAKK